MEGQKLTIIKKKKKGGAAGHHGGSWKVAFADFMTAMMAFFLLMWLLSMGPQKKKEELAHYFKTVSLFGEGGVASSSVSLSDTSGSPSQGSSEPAPNPSDDDTESDEANTSAMKAMKAQLERDIQQQLADVKDQVIISQFDGGIKIDIVDKTGQPMFQLGSAELTANAKKILQVITEDIKKSGRKLEIEGHTDAVSFSGQQKYGNWELSTARASAARIELERDGLSTDVLARVSGYADTEPLVKADPFDPRNRRISLKLLYPKKQQTPQPKTQPPTPVVKPDPIPPVNPSLAPQLGGQRP
jgi:chemotaxis protein MotB